MPSAFINQICITPVRFEAKAIWPLPPNIVGDGLKVMVGVGVSVGSGVGVEDGEGAGVSLGVIVGGGTKPIGWVVADILINRVGEGKAGTGRCAVPMELLAQ